MRGLRLDHVLASTALALVLAIGGGGASSANEPSGLESRVPLPEPADLPPPTAADISPVATTATAPVQETRAPEAPAPTERAAAPAPSEPAKEAVAPVKSEPAPAVIAVPAPVAAPVPQPAAAAPAAPAVAAVEPVAEKLREVIAGRLDRIFDRKKERDGVVAFYTARDFAPLWVQDGAANARARTAIAHLAAVEADGLDPSDYPTPDFKPGAEPHTLADAELRLTAAIVAYARHAHSGRVHFSRVSADVHYAHTPPETGDILTKLANAKDTAQALDDFNPPHKGYKALKAKLAEARNRGGEAGPARIPHGQVLKVGKNKRGEAIVMQDSRVPLLRERLGVAAADGSDTTYDKALADAVAKFQRQKGMAPNGQFNGATVDAMNGPRRDRDAEIIKANMERWRWMPRDLGNQHVVLNIPDYSLKVSNNGATIWTTRVVVGKPNTPTPILTETMKYITVNPTWNVPPSIIYNEYLPALQQDPGVLARMGLKLSQNRDGSVHISQPPGDRNALGRIRFNFPNKFLVYQHDTPDKQLFAHDKRAYSHGCMRVQDPLKYGEVLLSMVLPKEGYTQEKLRKMYGASEVNINLPTHIPVHITYQTAFVDDAGKLQIRDDIYGRDARVIAALKDERRVADIPMDRPQPNYSRPPARLPSGVAGAAQGGGYGGYGGYAPRQPSFFEALFGAGGPPEPPAPVRRRTSAR
jgi:murein L,D-transpeptidase YcbB/YkuD